MNEIIVQIYPKGALKKYRVITYYDTFLCDTIEEVKQLVIANLYAEDWNAS